MASKLLLITVITVLILDLIAFGLAIAAEKRRSKGTPKFDLKVDFAYCVYDPDIATGYGVGAFILLMASQIFTMVATRCFCGTPLIPSGWRACAGLFFLLSWVTFIIAEICLMAGSLKNAYHTKYRTRELENAPSCETVRQGVFAAGAAFVLVTLMLSKFYCFCYSKARGGFWHHGGGEAGIRMATYTSEAR